MTALSGRLCRPGISLGVGYHTVVGRGAVEGQQHRLRFRLDNGHRDVVPGEGADLAAASPAIQPVITERYGPAAIADLRLGDLDIVLSEYDAVTPPPAQPGLSLRQLAFDPYLLVIPPDWQVRPRSLRGLPHQERWGRPQPQVSGALR